MSNIACVVLAAGLSRRMEGQFKLLLPWVDGRPLLRHVVGAVQAAECASLVVVTGHRAEAVRGALQTTGVTCVHNPAYADGGMVSSLQVGLAALPDQAVAALVMPGDLPLIQPQTIRAVCAAYQPERIVVPRCAGQRGHPVLFPRPYWAELRTLPPDATPRAVIERHVAQRMWLDVPDVGSITDVDTPAAYQRALQLARQR